MSYDVLITELMNTMDKVALDNVLISGADICCPKCPTPTTTVIEGYWIPKITRIQYNGKTTIVWFADNTKVVVTLSDNDVYDRKTALVYAIVKRMLGKVNPDKTVSGNGFNAFLQKLADSGFDQEKSKQQQEAQRKKLAEKNRRKQADRHQKAFNAKVKARAEQMKVDEAARKLLKGDGKTVLNETTDDGTGYVRPNKKFADFTLEEKRAYWRNAKRK